MPVRLYSVYIIKRQSYSIAQPTYVQKEVKKENVEISYHPYSFEA